MSKLFQAFLTGLFFTSIFDFLFLLGLKLNYMDNHKLFIYYNEFFADNQNIYIFWSITLLLGYLLLYANKKIALTLTTLIFVLSILPFTKPIGNKIGAMLFMHKNVSYSDGKYTYTGDVYYHARESLFFYDYELQKIIFLDTITLKDYKQ